jgi:hypothetical protein
MDCIRALLEQLRDQLSDGGEQRFAGNVDAALASCDDAVAAFPLSDEFWRGAGLREGKQTLGLKCGHQSFATGTLKASNQPMKPTSPFRNAPSVFAATSCRGLSLSR